MNKKLGALVLSSLLVTTLLTSCGEEEAVTTPDVQQYAQQQANQPQQSSNQQQAPQQNISRNPATTTTTTPSNTGTTTTTNTTTTTTTTAKPATTTTTTDTSGLSISQKLLTKSKQNYDALKNYTATIIMYSKRNDKTTPKANPAINMKFKYVFQPPRTAVFDVLEHNISMVIGAKMVWQGGDSAKVKAAGVLGLFPMDMKLDDSKMTTNRSWRFDQLDHVAILGRANDPKSQLELAGKTQINGKDAYMIKVKNNGLDDEIKEEHIALDATTFMIVADEMYTDKELVFQLKMNVEGTNVSLPAGTMDF
ncbi:MAG: hypothetical protein U0354_08660 [Candidatus Sericytochromatia bacterium]